MTFQDVEKAREVYHKERQKYLAITLAATILTALFFGLALGPFSIAPALFILCAMAVFSAFATRTSATNYRKAYKGYFIEQNLQKIFTDLSYRHDAGINKSLIASTGMINTGDIFSSNDLVTAKYKDVSLIQADAHIQTESTDSDGNTTYVTIFKGRFMIFEFPKKFNFRLELIGRKFHPYRVPGKDTTTGRKLSKLSTESTEFNHSFKIFGDDGFETYYILDPALMVKINDIAEHYNHKILLGFINNKMMVALNDGTDSFEPPRPSRPINEATELAKVYADIKVITDFVDKLSLDHKLFTK